MTWDLIFLEEFSSLSGWTQNNYGGISSTFAATAGKLVVTTDKATHGLSLLQRNIADYVTGTYPLRIEAELSSWAPGGSYYDGNTEVFCGSAPYTSKDGYRWEYDNYNSYQSEFREWTSGATTFTDIDTGLAAAPRLYRFYYNPVGTNLSLLVSDDGTLRLIPEGQMGAYYSTDGGTTWVLHTIRVSRTVTSIGFGQQNYSGSFPPATDPVSEWEYVKLEAWNYNATTSPIFYTMAQAGELAKLKQGTVTTTTLGISNYVSRGLYVLDENTMVVSGYDTSSSKVRVYYTENNWSSYSHLGSTSELDAYGSSSWDVYATSLTDVWIVTNDGSSGWALHYDGTNWTVKITATERLYGMCGLSSNEVYFVGESVGFYMNFWKWDGVSATQTTSTSGMEQFTRSIATVDGNTFWIRGNDRIKRAIGFNSNFTNQRYAPSAFYQTARRVHIDDDGYIIAGDFEAYRQVVQVRTPGGSWSTKDVDNEGYLSSTKGPTQVTGLDGYACAVHAGDDANGGPNFCISTDNGSSWAIYDIPGWDPAWPVASPLVTSVAVLESNQPPILAQTPDSPNNDIRTYPMVWQTTDPDNQPSFNYIRLEGVDVVLNDVIQPGFTGTVIGGGNQVTVTVVADVDYWPTLELINWSVEYTDGTVTNTGSGSIVTPLAVAEFDRVFAVAKDVIRLDFTENVLSVGEVTDVTSYTIESLDSSPTPTIVEALPAHARSTTKIFLKVEALQYGGKYKLTLVSRKIKEPSGRGVEEAFKTWMMPRSKADSILQSLSGMYNTSTGSNLRAIIEAITISDEEIGGDY